MKKLWAALLLSVAVCCVFPAGAYATAFEWSIPEGNVTFTVPDLFDFYITQDSLATNPIFSYYDFDYDTFHEYLIENGIYFDAITADTTTELLVTVSDNSISSYNILKDDVLRQAGEEIASMFSYIGVTVLESEPCTVNQNKYIIYHTTKENDSGTFYGLQYNTIQGNKALNFTLWSYGDTISKTEEDAMYELARSATYTNTVASKASSARDQATSYSDDATGVSFTLPSGWYEETSARKDSNEEHFCIFTKGNKDSNQTITLICQSFEGFYETQCSDNEKEVAKKALSECSITDLLSKSDVAQLVSCSESDIKIETIGNKDFYVVNGNVGDLASEDSLSKLLDVGCEIWITSDERFIYFFCYTGDSASYNDFMSVISSSSIIKNAPAPSFSSRYDKFSWLICIPLGLLVLVLPIFLFKQSDYKDIKVSKKKSLLIVLVYCSIVNAVLGAFLGSAATSVGLLWYLIDYAILRTGYEPVAAKPAASNYVDLSALESSSSPNSPEVPLSPQSEGSASDSEPSVEASVAAEEQDAALSVNGSAADDAPTASFAESARDVAPSAPAEPVQEADTEDSFHPNFCYHCGFPLPKGCKFCPGCGTKL